MDAKLRTRLQTQRSRETTGTVKSTRARGIRKLLYDTTCRDITLTQHTSAEDGEASREKTQPYHRLVLEAISNGEHARGAPVIEGAGTAALGRL